MEECIGIAVAYCMAIVGNCEPPNEKRPWLLQAMDISSKPDSMRYHSVSLKSKNHSMSMHHLGNSQRFTESPQSARLVSISFPTAPNQQYKIPRRRTF